jgi:hypothetical protein
MCFHYSFASQPWSLLCGDSPHLFSESLSYLWHDHLTAGLHAIDADRHRAIGIAVADETWLENSDTFERGGAVI